MSYLLTSPYSCADTLYGYGRARDYLFGTKGFRLSLLYVNPPRFSTIYTLTICGTHTAMNLRGRRDMLIGYRVGHQVALFRYTIARCQCCWQPLRINLAGEHILRQCLPTALMI